MKITKLYYAFFALLLASQVWASSPSVQLLSERHRTEWNWVEYRLALKNLSDSQLKDLTVRYFAENPRIQYCKANPSKPECAEVQFGQYGIDSTLRAEVDYYSVVKSVKPKFYYGAKYTVIELKFSGSIPAKKKAKVNFRIMKKNYPAWDCTHDYSFQKNAAVQEENYMMAVYDANGNLLWGNDPVAFKRDTANVYWNDRSGTTVVSRYDGSDSSKVFDGRFWMLEGNSLTYEERKALDSVGVRILETTRYENKDLHLLKAVKTVTKKTLSKVISGFYNAFKADDTTPLSVRVTPEDIYEEKQNCDADGICSNVVSERSDFDMYVGCWPDLQMGSCKNVVLRCGADSVLIDRTIILAKVRRDSVHCLEKNKDVRFIQIVPKPKMDTYEGRNAINIEPLQLSEYKWQVSLAMPSMTKDWLSDVPYSGEGIVVDVHDGGIDFTHPAFNEIGADGGNVERKASGYDDTRKVADKTIADGHGTHVAGIIGGNGRLSRLFEIIPDADIYARRGVAPKVKFLSHTLYFTNERGDVVNHSHPVQSEDIFYYGSESARIDDNIFWNWSRVTDKGDNKIKTSVATIGNFGDDKGYHSASDNAKNPILVGSYNETDMVLSQFSGLGPTWDGRIKPDVMAPGDGPKYLIHNSSTTLSRLPVTKGLSVYDDTWRSGIFSTIPKESNGHFDVWYGPKSGTSQAAPFVTGIVALMYQNFREKTGEPLEKYSMRNSTTKALLIHTAIDMEGSNGYPNKDLCRNVSNCRNYTHYAKGPDYATGWGRVNAEAALKMMDGYNAKDRIFKKFREIEVFPRYQSRWNIDVTEKSPLRVTLVWDDAPGNTDKGHYAESKLMNDLDLYLISPSGEIYYPWRLDPLPNKIVDEKGEEMLDYDMTDISLTYEEISDKDVDEHPAYNDCSPMHPKKLYDGCFDRRNNVEVVDVKNPELGTWQVVVKGYRVSTGNGPDGITQIASLVSDYELKDPVKGDGATAPVFELQTPEVLYLGDGYLEHNVYFGPETQFGDGGHIFLFDGFDGFVGDFSDAIPLANRRVVVKSSFLQIVPARKNATAPGPKYSIVGVEHIPYGILQALFPPYKKK